MSLGTLLIAKINTWQNNSGNAAKLNDVWYTVYKVTHCYFRRLNIKRMHSFKSCFPALKNYPSYPKQKEILKILLGKLENI